MIFQKTSLKGGPTVPALIVANTVPLFGVLFGEWSVGSVVFLYWLETVVIGWFTVLKILRTEAPVENTTLTIGKNTPYTRKSRGFLVVFFIIHYGIFTTVHGAFVSLVFGGVTAPLQEVLLALLALVISHGVSYVVHFLWGGEYKRVAEDRLFIAPYPRIFFLHFFIFAGGLLVMFLGTPLLAVVLFVVVKTWIDALAHIRSHKILQK